MQAKEKKKGQKTNTKYSSKGLRKSEPSQLKIKMNKKELYKCPCIAYNVLCGNICIRNRNCMQK